MPPRACYRMIAVFTAIFSLPAIADAETARAQAQSALALNDCTAMIEASRLLAHTGQQDTESDEAVLRARLADAMLALPNCGESRFQLLRSRSLKSDPLPRSDEGRAWR